MAVVRVEHTENYSIISNVGLREKGLSLRAKGLLCVMLSLPKDWDYSLFGLSVLCGESEGKIKTTLNELKQFGYVEVKKLMPNETESGRIEYEYIVYEMPKQEGKKQALENQGVVFQAVENERLPNNNIYNINIKEQRTNKQIKEKSNNEVLAEYGFSDFILSYIRSWLAYKKERKQVYKPIGLTTLLKTIKQAIDDIGEKEVAKHINNSIANSWSGLFFPTPKSSENAYTPKTNNTKQLYDDNYVQDESGAWRPKK